LWEEPIHQPIDALATDALDARREIICYVVALEYFSRDAITDIAVGELQYGAVVRHVHDEGLCIRNVRARRGVVGDAFGIAQDKVERSTCARAINAIVYLKGYGGGFLLG